jgi:hypothetical protein
MNTNSLFNTIIDLPKNYYSFTNRCTFWQALINILAIFFISTDEAINDILMQISDSLRQKFEKITMVTMGWTCPKPAYA